MALVKTGLAGHGAAWFAHKQTAGKGQRGKSWQSNSGENIILSVLLDMSWLPVSEQFCLSMAISLAVRQFLAQYCPEDLTIKWPNDIYWRDRKAAGILVENVIKGNIWQWAVVGIGININQVIFDSALPNPVSLKQITGKSYEVVELARDLCTFLEQSFALLKSQLSPDRLLAEYNSRLYKRLELVNFREGNREFSAKIFGVDEKGKLILDPSAPKSYMFGELEWLH